jgi:hypothetical protein
MSRDLRCCGLMVTVLSKTRQYDIGSGLVFAYSCTNCGTFSGWCFDLPEARVAFAQAKTDKQD